MATNNIIPVAVLGASGMVGQKVLALLQNNPRFRIAEVVGSSGRDGKVYADSVVWREMLPKPAILSELVFKPYTEIESPFVISALGSSEAAEIEPYLTAKGHHVFSNASTFRMNPRVPLLIPAINASHLNLVDEQQSPGKLVTNPNCAVSFACMALAPLRKVGTISHISMTTLQAVSGAGYPGVSAMDILSNVLVNIPGEDDKLESECQKILGATGDTPAPFTVIANATRVPVVHGHTVIMHVYFENDLADIDVSELFRSEAERNPDLYRFYEDGDYPQPRRDIYPDDRHAHIGKVKEYRELRAVSLVVEGHNLVMGAAGAVIANMNAFLDYQADLSMTP